MLFWTPSLGKVSSGWSVDGESSFRLTAAQGGAGTEAMGGVSTRDGRRIVSGKGEGDIKGWKIEKTAEEDKK